MVRRHRATYSSQESTYLKAFFLPTSTGWQLIKHQSIFKNHMSFQIYAKRSFKCRWSHIATTIHRKMQALQRQPCSQSKLGLFLPCPRLRKILNCIENAKLKNPRTCSSSKNISKEEYVFQNAKLFKLGEIKNFSHQGTFFV